MLYVGKAQTLRSRVRQYWQQGRGSPAALRLEGAIDRVADVEYTVPAQCVPASTPRWFGSRSPARRSVTPDREVALPNGIDECVDARRGTAIVLLDHAGPAPGMSRLLRRAGYTHTLARRAVICER